ncbi:MAG: class I SAM-dependent methyltransferase [Acidimicrobiia bacterium]
MDFAEAQAIAATHAPSDYYVDAYREMERMYLPSLFASLDDIQPGRILEVGPGWGTTAVWLKDKGHDVTVMDLLPVGTFMAQTMCDEYDINFVHNNIEDAAQPDGVDLGMFDSVIMTQVIPHLAWRPDRTLRHISSFMGADSVFHTSVLDIKDYKDLDTTYGSDWTKVPEWETTEMSQDIVKCMYSKRSFKSLLDSVFPTSKVWKPFRSTVLFAEARI